LFLVMIFFMKQEHKAYHVFFLLLAPLIFFWLTLIFFNFFTPDSTSNVAAT